MKGSGNSRIRAGNRGNRSTNTKKASFKHRPKEWQGIRDQAPPGNLAAILTMAMGSCHSIRKGIRIWSGPSPDLKAVPLTFVCVMIVAKIMEYIKSVKFYHKS